jgi:hypothetical protein
VSHAHPAAEDAPGGRIPDEEQHVAEQPNILVIWGDDSIRDDWSRVFPDRDG